MDFIQKKREAGKNNVIILDEIGKMECFSEVFKQAATNALDSSNIVAGTITLGGDDYIYKKIKNREDIEINEVTLDNRDTLPDLILTKISNTLKTKDKGPSLHLLYKTSNAG